MKLILVMTIMKLILEMARLILVLRVLKMLTLEMLMLVTLFWRREAFLEELQGTKRLSASLTTEEQDLLSLMNLKNSLDFFIKDSQRNPVQGRSIALFPMKMTQMPAPFRKWFRALNQ